MQNLWRFQLLLPLAQPMATEDTIGAGTVTFGYQAARSGITSLATDISRISPGTNRRRLP